MSGQIYFIQMHSQSGQNAALGSQAPDKEDTHDKLLRSALKLFSEAGFEATTVKQIADLAGVNVSLVSYHFGGKENLYRACLEQFGKESLAAAQRMLQTPHSLEEVRIRLQMFVEEMFTTHIVNPEVCRMVHREVEKMDSVAEDIFKNTFLKVYETLIAFFSQAQGNGLIRKDLNPMIITKTFWGSVMFCVKMDAMGEKHFGLSIKDPAHREAIIQHLMTLLLHGYAENP